MVEGVCHEVVFEVGVEMKRNHVRETNSAEGGGTINCIDLRADVVVVVR